MGKEKINKKINRRLFIKAMRSLQSLGMEWKRAKKISSQEI